jgi:murein DD-endopeptidase MepM/ murein hydrolase activator NlpD
VLRRQAVVIYAEPVEARVVDRFRPPSTPYGPGNRGWEYATEPGSTVRAAADGTVTFAGAVGGTIAVTVAHADGLRTSYSYLERALVTSGDHVRLGDPVGRSGSRLHFGVRRGDVYLDPALLFAPPAARRVRLVPLAGA